MGNAQRRKKREHHRRLAELRLILRAGKTVPAAASALGMRECDLWRMLEQEVDCAISQGKLPEEIARKIGVEVAYVHDREAVRHQRDRSIQARELSRGRGWQMTPQGPRWMPPREGTTLRRLV